MVSIMLKYLKHIIISYNNYLTCEQVFQESSVTIMFKYLKHMYHIIIILPAIKCFKQPLVTIMLKY